MTSRDPHSWMWAEALGLLEQADRLQRQFFGVAGATAPRQQAHWEPPVDVIETAGEIIVIVALPGIAPEQVEIEFDNGVLAVRADRHAPLSARTTAIRRLEIPYGRFERSMSLPVGQYELVAQASVHGCLELRLQKR